MAPGLGREAGFTAKGIREIGGIAETTGVCDEIDRDGGVFKQAFRSNKTLAANLVADRAVRLRREKMVEL